MLQYSASAEIIPSITKPTGITSLLLFHSGEIHLSSAKYGKGKQEDKTNWVGNKATLVYRQFRSRISLEQNMKKDVCEQILALYTE